MINIGVAGATGKMGQALIRALSTSNDQEIVLSAAICRPDSKILGVDAGQVAGVGNLNVPIVASLEEAKFDCLIDFTLVESALEHLEYCQSNKRMLVIGTTGFDAGELQAIQLAGQRIPIVLSPNMSIGVNVCFNLLKQVAAVFGDDADIEILETHHRHKLDAPSGTALRMGEVIAKSLGRDLADCAVYGRKGFEAVRDQPSIGFSSVRAGDVVGDHTVLFATEGERLEITHKASNRQTFANGALRAARWLAGQENGVYDMQDVLGLKSN